VLAYQFNSSTVAQNFISNFSNRHNLSFCLHRLDLFADVAAIFRLKKRATCQMKRSPDERTLFARVALRAIS
jgi:hypothetical protein